MDYPEYYQSFLTEMKIHNYSKQTVRSYSSYLRRFFKFREECGSLEPGLIIRDFLGVQSSNKVSKQCYYSVKLFYRLVLGKDCPYVIEKRRYPRKLPNVISHKDIMTILSFIENRKHRLMISFLYGSGLRVSEVVKLKVSDIDFEHEKLIIKDGKGGKDRITLLSDKLLPEIKELISDRRGSAPLFLSALGKAYCVRTVQQVFKTALLRSRLNIEGSCHSLRHSFATHLMEKGVNIKIIMNLMGHKSVKTTMQYLHLVHTNNYDIESPL